MDILPDGNLLVRFIARNGDSVHFTSVARVVVEFGDTNVAISIAAVIAMTMSRMYARQAESLADQIQQAMQEAGVILLICCGGGAFGAALYQTGVGPFIQRLSGSEQLDFALLPIAFLVTAVIRTAQGSNGYTESVSTGSSVS